MSDDKPLSEAERLGSEIREVRKARGLTLSDLSESVSCSAVYLSRIERGLARISPDLLAEISATLAVDAAWFFPQQFGKGPLERQHVVRTGDHRLDAIRGVVGAG